MLENIKICLVCVCYNAHEDASKFLLSIEKSFFRVSKLATVELTVVLSDNSNLEFPESKKSNFSYNFKYRRNENIGYFPAFNAGLNEVFFNRDLFDYIIVSNVDLEIDVNFFERLIKVEFEQAVGVIAPRIMVKGQDFDQNPKILERPKKSKFIFMLLICSNTFLFSFYKTLHVVKRWLNSSGRSSNGYAKNVILDIYAPHGAFIIFTKSYIQSKASTEYPRMLFGEEIFVAEQARISGLKVRYNPSLVVFDREHGSTSFKSAGFLCKHNWLSYRYLLENFFR